MSATLTTRSASLGISVPCRRFRHINISTGATGYVVYNGTVNPDTAAAFALFFLTEEGQRAYHSQTGGSVPLLKTLAEEDFWMGRGTNWEDKNYSVFVAYPDYTAPASIYNQAPGVIADMFSGETMRSILASIVNGQKDAQTAFREFETLVNEKWATVLF